MRFIQFNQNKTSCIHARALLLCYHLSLISHKIQDTLFRTHLEEVEVVAFLVVLK